MYIFQSRIHPLPPVNLPSLPSYPRPFLSFLCIPYKGNVEQWEKDREIWGIWAEGCGGWPSKDVVIYIRRIIDIHIYIYIRRRVVGILFKSLCCPAHTLRREEEGRVKRRASPWSFYYRDHLFVNIIYTLRGQHAPP